MMSRKELFGSSSEHPKTSDPEKEVLGEIGMAKLRKFFPKRRSHFLRMSISLSTANYFRAFTNTPERLEIITSQRKNGCLLGQPLSMAVLPN